MTKGYGMIPDPFPHTQCVSIRAFLADLKLSHADNFQLRGHRFDLFFFFPWKCKTGESNIVALLIKTIYTWQVAQDWLKAG